LTADTKNGIYIGQADDPTATTKCAVRRRETSEGVRSTWFKLLADTSEAQSINSAYALASYLDETKVVMPSGTLTIDETITTDQDILLVGAGTNRPTGSLVGTVLLQAFNGNIIESNDGLNVRLRDFSIQGDAAYTSGWGIYSLGTNYEFDLNAVTIHKMPSGGVYVLDAYKANFTNVVIQRCLGWGLRLDGYCNNFVMSGGEVSGNGVNFVSGGIKLTFNELNVSPLPGNNQIPLFIGVTIEGNKFTGVNSASGWFELNNCYIEGNTSTGVFVSGGHCLSTHNWYRSNGTHDIRGNNTTTDYPSATSISDIFSGITNICIRAPFMAFNDPNRVRIVVRDPIFLDDVVVKYDEPDSMKIEESGVSKTVYHTTANQPALASEGASESVLVLPGHDKSGRLHKAFNDDKHPSFFLCVDYGDAPPTTGTWERGFIRLNDSMSAGGVFGWVCVAAGTPGTWKSFATVSA
jgi:hypothetical protein